MKHRVRNWFVVGAAARHGGAHTRSLNEPRGGQRNVQREYLAEYHVETTEVADDFDGDDVYSCWD
jgi:hypothetical protein